MKSFIKSGLQYLLSLGLGIFLLWYVTKDYKTETILSGFRNADYTWVIIAVIISLISHWSRAVRWNLLMEPLGYTPPVFRTFLAVMVGYFTNLFAPRLGEVGRCAILNKMEGVPVGVSFGSVVAERVFDFICLLCLVALTLFLEFNHISGFLSTYFIEKYHSVGNTIHTLYWVIFIAIAVILSIAGILYYFRNHIRNHRLYIKIAGFLSTVWYGLINVRKMKRKWAFLFHTILIWVCYYFMTYIVFFSLPGMSHLSMAAGLVVLVVGGLGMSAPVQAGIGAFHFFVAKALLLYGLPLSEGYSYAFLIHTSQSLSVIFFGGISFILALLISKKSKLTVYDK